MLESGERAFYASKVIPSSDENPFSKQSSFATSHFSIFVKHGSLPDFFPSTAKRSQQRNARIPVNVGTLQPFPALSQMAPVLHTVRGIMASRRYNNAQSCLTLASSLSPPIKNFPVNFVTPRHQPRCRIHAPVNGPCLCRRNYSGKPGCTSLTDAHNRT